MPTPTPITSAATLRQERLDVQRFPGYSELSAPTQARLRRLAARKIGFLLLWADEADELQAICGDSAGHLRVPCKTNEHGRMVCFNATARRAWTAV